MTLTRHKYTQLLMRYKNMLMYYKYDEFSMYKAMGFVAKNEENGNSFALFTHNERSLALYNLDLLSLHLQKYTKHQM